MSVSPVQDDCLEGNEDEDSPEEYQGLESERLGLDKEDEVVRKTLDPKLPTDEDVEKHYLMGHNPYRNWCPVCVRAKGKDLDHQRDKGGDRRLPECSWDYCFPGDEMGFHWTVLVGRERMSGMRMATAVPTK